jgi:hypothetical protein
MDLDRPLGVWLPVARNTWHDAYRTRDAVLWRKTGDETLHVLERATAPGFYEYSRTTTTLPLECYPINIQMMGDTAWTHRHYSPMTHTDTGNEPPPGHVIEDTIEEQQTTQVALGSDGSIQYNIRS